MFLRPVLLLVLVAGALAAYPASHPDHCHPSNPVWCAVNGVASCVREPTDCDTPLQRHTNVFGTRDALFSFLANGTADCNVSAPFFCPLASSNESACVSDIDALCAPYPGYLAPSTASCNVTFPVWCPVYTRPSCVPDYEHCDLAVYCPDSRFPIPCANGQCAADFYSCPGVARNSCLRNASSCPGCPSYAPLRCWDGSCVADPTNTGLGFVNCPLVPRCPGLMDQRCPDGACISPGDNRTCAFNITDLGLECGDPFRIVPAPIYWSSNAFCYCPLQRLQALRPPDSSITKTQLAQLANITLNPNAAEEWWGPCMPVYGCYPDTGILCPGGNCVSDISECVGGKKFSDGTVRPLKTKKCSNGKILSFGKKHEGDCVDPADAIYSPIIRPFLPFGLYQDNQTADRGELAQPLYAADDGSVLGQVAWPAWIDAGYATTLAVDPYRPNPTDTEIMRADLTKAYWKSTATMYTAVYSPLYTLSSPEIKRGLLNTGNYTAPKDLLNALNKWEYKMQMNLTYAAAHFGHIKRKKLAVVRWNLDSTDGRENGLSNTERTKVKMNKPCKSQPDIPLPLSDRDPMAACDAYVSKKDYWVYVNLPLVFLQARNVIFTCHDDRTDLENPVSIQGPFVALAICCCTVLVTVACANWERAQRVIAAAAGRGGGAVPT